MDEPRHLHPLQIFPLIGRYLFLLLLPLVRGLLAIRSPYALYAWLRGAWFDLLILLLIGLFSYFSWRCGSFFCQDDRLFIRSGLFFRRETVIPLSHITTLSAEAPFYLAPVRAKRVLIHTAGRTRKNADFRLLVYSRDAQMLLRARLSGEAPQQRRYRPRWRHLLFLSVFVSNTATGVLYLSTAFNQLGRMIGRAFQQQIISDLEHLAGVVLFIPRTAAVIALILLIGWVLALLMNLMHYIGFAVTRYPSRLHIRAGLLVRRHVTCSIRAIDYLDYRQSIISRLLRLYVVFIHCAGYGGYRREKAVLLPAVAAGEVDDVTGQLLWELPQGTVRIRPVPRALWRYIRPALLIAVAIPAATAVAAHLFAPAASVLRVLGVMALLPVLWWLLLKGMERRFAGIGVADTRYTLRYARGFSLHTVVIPPSNIRAIRVRQSLFQQKRGACDVMVYAYHDRRCHRIRQLPIDRVYTLLNG